MTLSNIECKFLLLGHDQMRGIPAFKKIFVSLIGLSSIALLLSGCLVENKDPPPIINRTTDNLRLINAGDRIVYTINGTITNNFVPTTVSGQMTVEWFDDFIEDPHNAGNTIPVLREVTVLTYDQGGGNTFTRYITQDPDGTIYLHAYYDKNITNLVYVGAFGATPYIYEPIAVVSSPIQMADSTYSYRVLNCIVGNAQCEVPSLRAITEADEYISEYDIVTRSGKRYNTLYFSYTGRPLEGVSPPLASPLDYRMACDPNAIEFDGEYYYFPEVGLVEFFSSCTGSTGTGVPVGHRLRGSLLSTSFATP